MIENVGLYNSIMQQLKFDLSIDKSKIAIAIKSDGIGVLNGKVASYSDKYLVERTTEKIETVKKVANELEIDLNPIYKGSEIVKAALNSLKWTFFVPHDRIKLAVEKGHLTLFGDLEYHYQKERAEEAVEGLNGLTSVTNNIKIISSLNVKPGPSEVKEKITKEFERNARIDASNIQVEADDSKVTFEVSVKNFDEAKRLEPLLD